MNGISFEELLRRYAAGERNFAGVEVFLELRKEGMYGIDLSGVNFRSADLHRFIHCAQ